MPWHPAQNPHSWECPKSTCAPASNAGGDIGLSFAAGNDAVEYFVQNTPVVKGLMEDENEAEWIVDLTVQADRQNRAGEFAEAWRNSQQKIKADADLDQLVHSTRTLIGERRRGERTAGAADRAGHAA